MGIFILGNPKKGKKIRLIDLDLVASGLEIKEEKYGYLDFLVFSFSTLHQKCVQLQGTILSNFNAMWA